MFSLGLFVGAVAAGLLARFGYAVALKTLARKWIKSEDAKVVVYIDEAKGGDE